ncbi:UDP-glucose 4-epimerase GalE [Schnuerera sp. xch1]|uniref:UDP-glucose 4-epimerase GalE n=1 Tax=Schnuerera sp. xch1 TaxID=2874283 RepID=UPI001CBD30C5|nr:UDP-glucose 4-epimerase GalE [Schnuerera sp. xch1]MBZ2174514.1 UDP-glucose 4-epimerase GalE [Schnuerera sp. xch1]
MTILVTGGAGYIGSHVVKQLLDNNEEVLVLDNLETGHKEAVLGGKLLIGDLRDNEFMINVFRKNEIEGIIHFAANSLVGESMKNPYKYYENNVYGTLCLLKQMVEHNIDKIVFSSTAATYGNPEEIPIKEDNPTNPTNVYGETKLTMERMFKWFNRIHGIDYISLRYFNAAGADKSGMIGERHDPETHLIPNILMAAIKNESIKMFGDDYPTRDGTCIRDYIHVTDLSDAHLLSFDYLRQGKGSNIFNIGSQQGYTVKEVIEAAKVVLDKNIRIDVVSKRAGDPAILIASSEKIKKELEWKPRYSDMRTIISTAWNFMKNHHHRYNNER